MRHVGERVQGGAVPSIGGKRDCYSVRLSTLHQKAVRLHFVAFRHPTGDDMLGYKRCWFTLYRPAKGRQDTMKELYACHVADGGPFSCVLMATLTRRTSDVWLFGCNNEKFVGVPSPQKLVPILAPLDPVEAFDAAILSARGRLCHAYVAMMEENVRRLLAIQEQELRTEMSVLRRLGVKQVESRVAQKEAVLAFKRNVEESREKNAAETAKLMKSMQKKS